MDLAVRDRARDVPGAEYRLNGLQQLLARVLRERHADLLAVEVLLHRDDLAQAGGGDVHVLLDALLLLDLREKLLEVVALGALYYVGEHHDEAAVGVVDEALIAGEGHHRLGDLIVHPEVQDRVHHAGHREAGARADRKQQRVLIGAEVLADLLLE